MMVARAVMFVSRPSQFLYLAQKSVWTWTPADFHRYRSRDPYKPLPPHPLFMSATAPPLSSDSPSVEPDEVYLSHPPPERDLETLERRHDAVCPLQGTSPTPLGSSHRQRQQGDMDRLADRWPGIGLAANVSWPASGARVSQECTRQCRKGPENGPPNTSLRCSNQKTSFSTKTQHSSQSRVCLKTPCSSMENSSTSSAPPGMWSKNGFIISRL